MPVADSTPTVVFVVIVAFAFIGLMSGDVWKSKGGPWFTGFLIGLVFGPLGLFFTGFAKPGRDACPYCRNRVPVGASVCPTCSRDVALS